MNWLILLAGNLPVWVVEGHCVDDISVLVEWEQLLTGHGVPHFARAIVTSSDEFASIFVEGTVSQGKQVSSQHLEQFEVLLLVLTLLLNEFLDQLFQLRFARVWDQRLLKENLVNESVDIRSKQRQSGMS